jgi:hypothetical protein
MLHLVETKGTYSPETIAIMGDAFDRAYHFLSKAMNSNGDANRLALIILRLVDSGECDPARLTEIAIHEWTAIDRSVIGARGPSEGLSTQKLRA